MSEGKEQGKYIIAGKCELETVENGSKAYLTVEVPADCKEVQKVVMECESHDQGWSSYPSDQGTYSNSWTWGDLVVLDDKGSEVSKVERVYTNLHADSKFQKHEACYTKDQAPTDKLGPGKKLVLFIIARYPQWENFTRYAQLKLHYT